jgi:hypothetical protein
MRRSRRDPVRRPPPDARVGRRRVASGAQRRGSRPCVQDQRVVTGSHVDLVSALRRDLSGVVGVAEVDARRHVRAVVERGRGLDRARDRRIGRRGTVGAGHQRGAGVADGPREGLCRLAHGEAVGLAGPRREGQRIALDAALDRPGVDETDRGGVRVGGEGAARERHRHPQPDDHDLTTAQGPASCVATGPRARGPGSAPRGARHRLHSP